MTEKIDPKSDNIDDIMKMEEGYIDPKPGDAKPEEDEAQRKAQEEKDAAEKAEAQAKAEAEAKAQGDANEAKGLNRDGSAKEPKSEEPLPERPKKYIPLPQYQDEKKTWEKTQKEKDDEIAGLKKKLEEKIPGSDEHADEIKTWADKHGYAPEAAQELADLIVKRIPTPKEDARVAEILKREEERKDEEHFEKEWSTTGIASLKQHFPNATDEQLGKAKKVIDEHAHSKTYHNSSLDYVVYKSKDELSDIFGKPGKPSVEDSRPGGGQHTDISASSFRPNSEGKFDFKPLESLSADDRQKVISQFKPGQYWEYLEYEKTKDMDVFEVSRNGQRVTLK